MKKILHMNMRRLCLYWALGLIAAGIIAALCMGQADNLIADLIYIMLSPDKSADYFAYASLGAALVNTGLCGLAVVIVAGIIGAEFNSAMLAAFFLMIGHGTLGKSILNIWPCAIGTAIFFAVSTHDIKDHLYMCIMASCFGPLVSEIMFRYTLGEFDASNPIVTAEAFLMVIAVSLIIGALFPKFLRLSLRLNRGYTLFNAGAGGGLLAVLLYFVMYQVFAHDVPYALAHDNVIYASYSGSYFGYVNLIVLVLCGATILWGVSLNAGSLKGYRELLFNKTGNLLEKYGEPLCIINIGISGLFMLAVYDFFILTDMSGVGAGFTGMTTGALLASMSFAAGTETPACTWPIIAGYLLLALIRTVTGGVWHPALQSNLSSMAFAIGMCPIVLRRGRWQGVAAGLLCSWLVPHMSVFHGGLMLYNSGFTTGIVASVMAVGFDIRDRIARGKE